MSLGNDRRCHSMRHSTQVVPVRAVAVVVGPLLHTRHSVIGQPDRLLTQNPRYTLRTGRGEETSRAMLADALTPCIVAATKSSFLVVY